MFETYSTLGGLSKRKLFNFLLLVHSQLCGGRPTKRKSFDFLLLVYSHLSTFANFSYY
ncbi:hypothetical protein [Globicatella sanguinis]